MFYFLQVKFCYFSLTLLLETEIYSPGEESHVPEKMILCSEGTTTSWNTYDIQNKLNFPLHVKSLDV